MSFSATFFFAIRSFASSLLCSSMTPPALGRRNGPLNPMFSLETALRTLAENRPVTLWRSSQIMAFSAPVGRRPIAVYKSPVRQNWRRRAPRTGFRWIPDGADQRSLCQGLFSLTIVGTVVPTRRPGRSISGQRIDLPFLGAEHSEDRHTLRLNVQPLCISVVLMARSPGGISRRALPRTVIFPRGAITWCGSRSLAILN